MLLDASFKGGADNLLSGKYTLGFAADTSFRRSDYEIDSLGALVADVVFVEINGEFQAAD
jgi:polyisoprenoid-binding protein YceI